MQLFKLTHTQDRYNFTSNTANDIYLGEPTKGHYIYLASYIYISTLFTKENKLLIHLLEFYLKELGKLNYATN